MKLITYNNAGNEQLALKIEDRVYDMDKIDMRLPGNIMEFLWGGEEFMSMARGYEKQIASGSMNATSVAYEDVELMAPVPLPTSARDAYAFRQHVASARKNRGVDMIPEFDQFPIWYFTNHNSFTGPGAIELMPDHFQRLDFELEIAIVVGKKGRNIKASQANEYIAGYCIYNDWSARQLQMEEMKLNLGPAKGKDFANSIGPFLVTPDELAQYAADPYPGHTGTSFNLEMKAWHNGDLVSEGNMNTMFWTFEEILERASYGADIYPGDVIGSGTVGTGCYLELNGTHKLENPDHEPVWVKPDDIIDMEITGLGRLSNQVQLAASEHSLLAIKHQP